MAVLDDISATRFPHDTPTYRQRTEMGKVRAAITLLSAQMGQKYAAATDTAGFTATGPQLAGAGIVTLDLTGTLGAGAALTVPTVAALVAAIPGARVGQTYRLRIMNRSSGNFAWTLTTATGWTLTGTMTVAQNTYRDFLVTLTSLSAIAVQSLGQVIVA